MGFKEEIKELRKKRVEKGFKVVITGKGGAGKTTLSALLAFLFAHKGYNVLTVDEDPQINLPFALGYPIDKMKEIVPLSKQADYIEEKTGARPDQGWGGFLRLNPPVEDVVDRFGLNIANNLNCLVMGTINKPATGCLCPENALLDAVVSHISLRDDELILLDTQAGVEHFGRALAKGFSQCLVVSDPTFNAMSVAVHSANLARDLGIKYVHLVLNKVKDQTAQDKALSLLQQLGKPLADFSSVISLPVEEKLLEFEPAIVNFLKNFPDSKLSKTLNSLAQKLETLEES